jgi:hypothetical protein
MRLKSVCLAGATLLSLAVPAAASADPYWGWRDGDDWRRHEWREHEWREHQWREHERWEHRPYAVSWYGAPRCVVEDRGFYDGWGRWVYRPVRACYR